MFNREIRIKFSTLFSIAYIYIYIPCITFVLTWLKPFIGVVVAVALIVLLVDMIRKQRDEDRNDDEDYLKIRLINLIIVAAVVLGITFIAGWPGYGHQTEDWNKHNAIMNDLKDRNWPVIYENKNERALLTYYIGQYLVPSFIGKVFSATFRSTLSINWIWSSVGLLIFVLVFMKIAGADNTKKQAISLFIIFLGAGLMVLMQAVGSKLMPSCIPIGQTGWRDYFFNVENTLQFRSNFVAIRWAFGQTIVPWIISVMLYYYKSQVNTWVPMLLPCILFGAFPFVGIISVAIVIYIGYCKSTKDVKIILKKTFSWENILCFCTLGIVLMLYYLGYLIQPKEDLAGFSIMDISGKGILIYLMFVMGSFGTYAVIIAKETKKDIAFWGAFIIMLILPFFKMGHANDLLMGACIGPSMILYLIMTKWLFLEDSAVMFRKGILVTLLVIGAMKPSLEIVRCVYDYDYTQYLPDETLNGSMERFVDRKNNAIPVDLRYYYYTYDADSCLFMKYVGRTRAK